MWLSKLLKFSQAEHQNPFSSVNFLFEEARETDRAMQAAEYAPGAILEVLDGFADSAFVALSGLRKTLREVKIPSVLDPKSNLGIPEDSIEAALNEIMDAVCTANLAKVGKDGQFLKDKSGKIKKPEGWVDPKEKIMDIVKKYAKEAGV